MSLLKALTDPRYWEEVATQGRNFGQATSNAVASLATAPVDLINMGLGFAGAPVSKTPVGGTEWLKQLGLYADVPQGAAQIAGETLGNVLPVAIPAKAPQIANGLLQALANAQRPTQLGKQQGAIVWHGSPHKFDRFDASKIGTGEGAQAYGHGLYFADSRQVAKEYQNKLSNTGGAKNIANQYGGIDDGILEATRRIDHYKKIIADGGGGDLRRANGMLRIAQKNLDDLSAMKLGLPENTGSLYKVDLPDEQIAKMIDWDKPLSKQSQHVKSAIAKSKSMLPQSAIDDLGGDLSLMYGPQVSPKDFLNTWEYFGIPAGGENALRSLGVPGVRYLDGGSSGAGQGTSNYVVFPGNEGLLSILSRNGVPLR